jgi:serine/threonine-protein kinase
MSSFLRFAVEQVLSDKSNELKEYVIGVEVFRRTQGYDTRLDPVVRVEARRLRSKLASYYEAEGKQDDIVIEFPKGSYVPTFRGRNDRNCGATGVPAAPTVAVLPFANMSPEPDNAYFSDGLTQDVIHLLTKVQGLRVLAWNSSVRLSSNADPREIGREFSVNTVLTGSVRRTPDRVRIAVQLVETATGFTLWSESYDRNMQDLFAIQEEIAAAIVGALRTRLVPGKQPDLRKSAPNLDAYNLYLRGRFYWNERTSSGLKRSVQFYQEALSIDPNFAMAYSGLSDSYSVMADYGLVHPSEALPRARTAAEQALALDPDLGEAESSLGLIRALYDWEWDDADRHFRRAIALNPSHVTAHHWYSLDCLAICGRMEEADKHIQIAHELDPFSPLVNEGVGYMCLLRREYDRAIREYRAITQLDPYFYKAYTSMGRAYIQLGRYDEAMRMLEKGRSLAGDIPSVLGAMGQAAAYSGDTERARDLLKELHRTTEQRYVPRSAFALVHLALGEKPQALDFLEESVNNRDLPVASINTHPAYDPLRDEPRFQALLRKLHLA